MLYLVVDNHNSIKFLQGCQVLSWLSELGGSVLRSSIMTRNHGHNLYKKVINQCCNPKCKVLLSPLEVHHIVPVSEGGKNEYINFIVLCRHCHRHKAEPFLARSKKNRKCWSQELLFRWKFQTEYLVVGKCSDDMSNHEYQVELNRIHKENQWLLD